MDEKTLAQRVKEKYPGVYDDMSDADLETKVLAAHPGVYDDLPRTTARPASTMKAGISPEAIAPGSGVGAHLARFLLQKPFQSEPAPDEPIPAQQGKEVFGPAAANRAMEEELATRNFGGKAEAGVGTALDDAALRLKQATAGLSPEEQQNVEFNRQIKGTGGGAAGNVGGNIAMLGPLARGATTAGEAILPAAVKRLATAFPRTAAVAAPAAGGAAIVEATQPTLPGESEAAQAGIGAAGGVAGKAVVSGVLPALVGGVKALLGKFAPEGTKITKEGLAAFVDAQKRDGIDPIETLTKANALSVATGRPVSLADVTGSDVAAVNTQKLLQTALSEAPGAVRAPVSRGLIERAKGQNERVTSALAEGLGGSKTSKSEVFDAIDKAKKEETGPLYDAAFANKTPVIDPRLDAIGDRPSMIAALKKVEQDALERGEPVEGPYTTKNLDMAKKKLYDMEDSLRRAGQNSDAAAIGNTRRQLTEVLDSVAPPEYQQARKVWGDYAEMKTQFENGMDVFKSDPAAITKTVDAASPAEHQAFVNGIVAKVNEMPSKEGLDWAGNTLLRDVNKMAKLKAAFGSGGEDAFQAFKSSLEGESMALRSSKLYPPKGVTYAHAAGQTPGEIAATAADIAHGGVGTALMKALKFMTGQGLSAKGSGRLSELAFGPAADVSANPMASKLLSLPGGTPGALPPEAGLVGPLEMLRLKQSAGP